MIEKRESRNKKGGARPFRSQRDRQWSQYTLHRLTWEFPVAVMCPAVSCLPAAQELIATKAAVTSTAANTTRSFVAMDI
jgi:hypothetical protein